MVVCVLVCPCHWDICSWGVVELVSNSSWCPQEVAQLLKLVEWMNKNQSSLLFLGLCSFLFCHSFWWKSQDSTTVSRSQGSFAYTIMSTLIKVTLDVLSRLLWTCQGPWDNPHSLVIMEVSRRWGKEGIFFSSKLKASLANFYGISSVFAHQEVLFFAMLFRSHVEVVWSQCLEKLCPWAWDLTTMGAGRGDEIFKGFWNNSLCI